MWAGELNAPPDAPESEDSEPKRRRTGDVEQTITLEPTTPITSVNPSGGSYSMGGATGSGGAAATRPRQHNETSNRFTFLSYLINFSSSS